MSNIDLNTLRDRAYKIACEHGFHDKELSNQHCLMLVISELSEAVEADRKGRRINKELINNWVKLHSETDITFKENFDSYIKDTVEDELADTAIRLLDLAGLRNINLNGRTIIVYIVSKKKSFTENCYAIIKDIVNYRYTMEECLNYAIRQIFEFANFSDIDLAWHIEQKMRYNELREKMHGKKY
nr:MAG TPA: NTP-PPase-like protein [Caudoviricetes sp.]